MATEFESSRQDLLTQLQMVSDVMIMLPEKESLLNQFEAL